VIFGVSSAAGVVGEDLMAITIKQMLAGGQKAQ
jgi:hypothetical protein